MRRFLSLVACFAILASSAHATVTLSLEGGILRNGAGTAVPNGGLILLVASTTDTTFSTPTSTSSTSTGATIAGDDVIVARFEVSQANSGQAGGYNTVVNAYAYSGNVGSGDPLQLYWFPSLTTASTTLGQGTAYGSYRTDAVSSGSTTGWSLPADGSTVNINFFTVGGGGSLADSLGNASLATDGTAVAAPTITTHPVSQTVNAGAGVTFSVAATSTGLSYQWKKGGTNISGATAATYTIASTVTGDAGSYTVTVANTGGNVTSNAATLTVNTVVLAPTITTQPANLTVSVGAAASFTVAATSTGLTYQWKKGGTDIAGATAATYTIAAAATGDAGSFTVTVTNSAGTVTSNAATLTVVTGPAITTQPASQTVSVGSSATFNVTATGTSLSYQWKKGGTDISGATAATYSIPAVALTDAGSFTVAVTNSAGTVTSAAAVLTVVAAPAITTQPASQTLVVGATATFTVVATGTSPTYQWRKGGTNISGATAATYTIAAVALADAGSFTVVVSNSAGTVTSNAAVLSVIPAFPAPAPTGYGAAATGGGTTGHVLVTNATDFRTQAESNSAAIITVSGTLSFTTKVNVKSNKTIQGLDANATISGNLELASGVTNVIIRGLNITNPAGDGITLSGATTVFITNVTFFNCSDTLLRIAAGADNVTVAWSEFYYTAAQTTHRWATLIGAASGETKALRVTLSHNFWSDRVDQQMPDSTYGQVHLFNNYFNTGAVASTSGSIARANAQFFAERNQYTGIVSPLSKTGGGLIRAIGNTYTTTTGTAADAGTDTVFTPTYSYRLLNVSDVTALVNAGSGNTAGAASATLVTGTASITASGTAITTGTAFTLTGSTAVSAITGWQWRLNNVDISGATSATYNVASAQSANAGIYTVLATNVAGEAIVSTPVTIAVNAAPPPPPPASGGGGGGGAPSTWFFLALAALAGLRRLTKKNN